MTATDLIVTDTDVALCVELDQRTNDAITVTLLLDPESGDIYLDVVDAKRGERFTTCVPRADASFAFQHPFIFAPSAA